MENNTAPTREHQNGARGGSNEPAFWSPCSFWRPSGAQSAPGAYQGQPRQPPHARWTEKQVKWYQNVTKMNPRRSKHDASVRREGIWEFPCHTIAEKIWQHSVSGLAANSGQHSVTRLAAEKWAAFPQGTCSEEFATIPSGLYLGTVAGSLEGQLVTTNNY